MAVLLAYHCEFGLFPEIKAPTHDEEGKRIRGKEKPVAKKKAMNARALADCDAWLNG